jgi:molecular chaperone Hsp31 and glyoxalase 3
MPWWVCEKLSALGAQIINTKADNSCHVDRRLVSGASLKAANDFGRLSATTLLAAAQTKSYNRPDHLRHYQPKGPRHD